MDNPLTYAEKLALINEYGELKLSKNQLYQKLSFADYSNGKICTLIRRAEEYRHRKISDRNLEVVYICGMSGSGKTTAARYFANKLGYDAFVSGTGDDILDSYDKQECIILDDFRARTFAFSELLKLLDNNTNSSVKSRYNNKDISNCKLIIITSIQDPSTLYKLFSQNDGLEPAEQLYRRINHHYFDISDTGDIEEFTIHIDKPSEKTGRTLGNMRDIYAELNITPGDKQVSALERFYK